MKKTILAVLSVAILVAGTHAQLLSNGDWESTLNLNWDSQFSADTQADLSGWHSLLKETNDNGAYVEPISGYGSGAVAAMKATITTNYFQQQVQGIHAGTTNSFTVNYDGGIRYHFSYSTDARDVVLRVSFWDVTDGVELAGTNVVTAYADTETSLHARSHVFTYDNSGLDGHFVALRFENITQGETGGPLNPNHSTVLIDNIVLEGPEPIGVPPVFVQDPFSAADGVLEEPYAGTIAGSATDDDVGDTLTYSKVDGPDWLDVAPGGALSGIPDTAGTNVFTVAVSDGVYSVSANLKIFVGGAVLYNGDWESTLNGIWSSARAEDSQSDLSGWFSSLKDTGADGAYVEPITGYGSGMVGALKATSAANYFQQDLKEIDASIGQVTVNYDGGIRVHSTYPSDTRDIYLRVSLWDATTDVELAGTNVVTAYTEAETSLHARSHLLSYDAAGLDGHTLALRFENITYGESAPSNPHANAVLFDNISVNTREILPVTLSISSSTPGNVEVSWGGIDGSTYVVMTNGNLIVEDWQEFMSTNVSDTGTVNISVPAAEDQLFYRVITE